MKKQPHVKLKPLLALAKPKTAKVSNRKNTTPEVSRLGGQTHTYSQSGFIRNLMLRDFSKNERERIVLPHCPLNSI